MKARLGGEGFIVRGGGGFTTEVPTVEGGFPACNDAAGKRRLKRR